MEYNNIHSFYGSSLYSIHISTHKRNIHFIRQRPSMQSRTLRFFLIACIILTAVSSIVYAADVLPKGTTKPALGSPWFPDRLHAFVWKNWESVPAERMAEVVGATPGQVRDIGRSMGLPPQGDIPRDFLTRGYISLIRRNWHLLPYDQLLTLLGWDAEKLSFTLREDDFLWVKLGSLKPECPPIRYEAPDTAVVRRCAEIRKIVTKTFGDELTKPAEPRFSFIRDLSKPIHAPPAAVRKDSREPLRYLYSYCAVYGDPLLYPELDPYPEGLLSRLAGMGVNGIWLHVVLRQLAPGDLFPGESASDAATRRANLAKLAEKTAKYGVRIFLYMNEPRAMPESYFAGREKLKGGSQGDYSAMCTSVPEVRDWMTGALRTVFREAPALGGVFTITGSENFTHCWSHGRGAAGCPRCSARSFADVAAEVNAAIEKGVHEGNPDAKVIAWDWGWPDAETPAVIEKLPGSMLLMSVSEWSLPIERGNIASRVGEYSISSVGPGPRAKKHWGLAKARGLGTVAKVQVNASWELSAMPYLPVMRTVAEHCRNLAAAGAENLMLSWTVGGYPSPNLDLVRRMTATPTPDIGSTLLAVATDRYGPKSAPEAVRAWNAFSDAFSEYPFHVGFVYNGPAQVAPANPLYPSPTGWSSTMVGFPYDDLEGWRQVYPSEVLGSQFEKMASLWSAGIPPFEKVAKKASTPDNRANARADLAIAEAAGLHFLSVADQIRFIIARKDHLDPSSTDGERERALAEMRRAAVNEIRTARRMFTLSRADSRIGFEASNHYYYLPLDFVEKVIDCEWVLDGLGKPKER